MILRECSAVTFPLNMLPLLSLGLGCLGRGPSDSNVFIFGDAIANGPIQSNRCDREPELCILLPRSHNPLGGFTPTVLAETDELFTLPELLQNVMLQCGANRIPGQDITTLKQVTAALIATLELAFSSGCDDSDHEIVFALQHNRVPRLTFGSIAAGVADRAVVARSVPTRSPRKAACVWRPSCHVLLSV